MPGGDGSDNAKAIIRIEWPTLASDWDMKVYRDANGDGFSVGEGQPIATSGQGLTDFEQATLVAPALVPGGRYVIRVVNFAAAEPYDGTITFEGPEPYQAAQTESWTLSASRRRAPFARPRPSRSHGAGARASTCGGPARRRRRTSR